MSSSSSRTGARAASLTRLPKPEARFLVRLVASGHDGMPADQDDAVAAALRRRDLAVVRGDRLIATAAGCARAARETGGDAAFLAQHRTLARRTLATERGPEAVLVDLDESPLAWLARRKGRDGKSMLAATDVAAGERLRADFTRAQMTPRVTANWEAAVSSGRRGGAGIGVDVADAVMAAKSRVAQALEAVGPELSGVLVDVCCFLKGLEEVERDRRWPARGAKLVLCLGLTRLARHYGLIADGAGSERRRIVSWGAPDSRPRIDGGEPS